MRQEAHRSLKDAAIPGAPPPGSLGLTGRRPDAAGLLQGTGRFMRHVKLAPGREADTAALGALIQAAYADMRLRLAAS